MKHSNETKARALEMMRREGVAKTNEEMGITKATLYKWRNEEKELAASGAAVAFADAIAGAKALLAQSDANWADDKEKLLAENVLLRAENVKLRNALRALLA